MRAGRFPDRGQAGLGQRHYGGDVLDGVGGYRGQQLLQGHLGPGAAHGCARGEDASAVDLLVPGRHVTGPHQPVLRRGGQRQRPVPAGRFMLLDQLCQFGQRVLPGGL
jgi:hypothetical protein